MASETKGSYGSRTFSYDAVGNVRRLVDRNARTTVWNYDKQYRVTSETWQGQSGSIIYGYDAVDRLTTVVFGIWGHSTLVMVAIESGWWMDVNKRLKDSGR